MTCTSYIAAHKAATKTSFFMTHDNAWLLPVPDRNQIKAYKVLGKGIKIISHSFRIYKGCHSVKSP